MSGFGWVIAIVAAPSTVGQVGPASLPPPSLLVALLPPQAATASVRAIASEARLRMRGSKPESLRARNRSGYLGNAKIGRESLQGTPQCEARELRDRARQPCSTMPGGYGPSLTAAQPSSAGDTRRGVTPRLAPEEGFEPPTRRLTAACSATELLRNVRGAHYGERPSSVKRRLVASAGPGPHCRNRSCARPTPAARLRQSSSGPGWGSGCRSGGPGSGSSARSR